MFRSCSLSGSLLSVPGAESIAHSHIRIRYFGTCVGARARTRGTSSALRSSARTTQYGRFPWISVRQKLHRKLGRLTGRRHQRADVRADDTYAQARISLVCCTYTHASRQVATSTTITGSVAITIQAASESDGAMFASSVRFVMHQKLNVWLSTRTVINELHLT